MPFLVLKRTKFDFEALPLPPPSWGAYSASLAPLRILLLRERERREKKSREGKGTEGNGGESTIPLSFLSH